MMISKLEKDSEVFKLDEVYRGFDDDLEAVKNEYEQFQIKMRKVSKRKNTRRLRKMTSKILAVRKHLEESYCFTKHSVFMNLRNIFKKKNPIDIDEQELRYK